MPVPTLSSRITAVTVFRRGAQVTRVATLSPGPQGLPSAARIEGLPMLLDDASLQVSLVALEQGATPTAGELRVTLSVPAPDPSLRPPNDEELEAARLACATAERTHADLETLGARISTLAPGPRGIPKEGEPPQPSPTEARLALLDFRRERLARLEIELSASAERRHHAREHLATLEERDRRASQAQNPREYEARKAVVLSLVGASDASSGPLQVQLRYFVEGARWAPSYVLRLDPARAGGTLELRALVGQRTGEAWSDVALTLSTAHPQGWTELPELRSFRIGRRQPPAVRAGWRPPPVDTEQLFADYDRELRRPATPPPPPRAAAPSSTSLMDLDELDDVDLAVGGRSEPAPTPARRSAPRPMAPPAPAPAGPLPPAAAAMAPPAPMIEVESSRGARRRSGLVSAVAGGIGEMFASSDGGPPLQASQGFGGGAQAPEPDPPATLMADRALLEYGRLRMGGADERARGVLAAATPAQLYGQHADLEPAAIAAALERERVARGRARAVEGRAAPAGHHWAQGADGFDYAYGADAPASIDGDGEFHGLALSIPSVETTARYITVPRETTDVFRVVVLRNPLDAPLLPGPVDVYESGRFVVATTVDLTAPRGRLELGLGVEQAIKVARNVAFDDESSGLLKRHRELEHRVQVELANHLEHAATVEVRERVPVPDEHQDDIEINERTVDPAWDELTQDDPPLEGGRVWKVEVPAGAERTLAATWAIRIPHTHELVGGNRRES